MMIKARDIVALLLWWTFAVSAVGGQDAAPPQCDCVDLNQRHDKCVNDWRALDVLRIALEEQVRDAGTQCQGQVEQLRTDLSGECNGQVEQTRAEGNAKVEQMRQEVTRSSVELKQCKEQYSALSDGVKKDEETKQKLLKNAQDLTEQLVNTSNAKRKLERDLKSRDETVATMRQQKMAVSRELADIKKELEELVAAKTIITVDYDLLNERVEQIKEAIMDKVEHLLTFMAEKFEFVRIKLVEFWTMLQTKVFPKVQSFVEKDVIPMVKKTWKQAKDLWEETYGPYREPVNKHVAKGKEAIHKFYTANLQPFVKQHELDKHFEAAKKIAVEYMTLAHNHLVEGVDTSSGIALKFAKVEQFSPFIVEKLEVVNSNTETAAFYIECFLAFLIVRFLFKTLFFRKKKKKPKMTKKQWQEKQEAEKAKAKQMQGKMQGNKGAANKNGNKNSKKNK